jgi:hypothetical protein
MEDLGQKVSQNETKVIQCERCSKEFTRFTHLRRHFNNKKICNPVLKDIPIEELIEKYKVKKECYKCENCGKEYKSKSGKYKHKKKCLLNPAIIEKKEKEELKTELERKDNELDELKKQLLIEKKRCEENAKIINNNNTNNTNSHNTNSHNTNNIVFNFNDEKYNVEELKQIILNNEKSSTNLVKHFLEYVHFNPQYPENQNLKLTNLKPEYKWIDIMINGKWEKDIQDNILNTILHKLQKEINKIIKEFDPDFRCFLYDSDGEQIISPDCVCEDEICNCNYDLTENESEKKNYKLKEFISKSNTNDKLKSNIKNKAKITIYNKTKELKI